MIAAFHYAVKVKLIRYDTKDDIDFIDYDKVFENENPILARIIAFKEYEEWLKDLYTGIGKAGEYSTDKQARIDLQKFIIPSDKHRVQINENEIDFGNSFDYGIGVYMVMDKPVMEHWEIEDDFDKVGGELLIHGIGTTDKYNDPLEISDALDTEIGLYKYYNYDKGGLERRTNFYDWDLGDTEEIHFLETPFDWTGLDIKPEEETKITEQKISETIEQIIANGEGEQVEFKPTLSYHFTLRTWQGKYEVNYKIAKAICAFLNSKGGLLFIGIKENKDNGVAEVQGLDFDFSLSDKANKIDYFKLDFDRVLENFLGFSVKPIVNIELIEVKGKQICIVNVEPSKHKPVFLKTQESKKEFWVRGNASNRLIIDIEEIFIHWLNRQ